MTDIKNKLRGSHLSQGQTRPNELMRVLVVDDDPIFRSIVAAKLARIAGEVLEAGDGAAAWELVARESVQLALVDLEMPNMKGVELIRCIRGHPRTRHVPVVVITSRNDSEAVRGSLEAGATSFMTKPVNWSMFANHIDYLLRLHSAAERGRKAEQLAAEASSSAATVISDLELEVASVAGRVVLEAEAALKSRGSPDAADRMGAALETAIRDIVGLKGRLRSMQAAQGELLTNRLSPGHSPQAASKVS